MKAFTTFAALACSLATGCRTEYQAASFEPPDRQPSITSAELPAIPTPATLAGQDSPAEPARPKVDVAGFIAPDRDFVEAAVRSGLFEIESSRIATSKAISESIRDFASMMVEDHSKLNRELEAIADARAMTTPLSVDLEQRTILDELRAVSGPPFDARYHAAQLASLEQAVDLFGRAAIECRDQDLRRFARDALPMLKEQRAELEAIRVVVETARSCGE